jgi:voltage-gated potassium channel
LGPAVPIDVREAIGVVTKVANVLHPARRKIRPAIDYDNHPVFRARPKWRCELHRIIFGHLTPAGKLFDIILIAMILVSVAVVMIESVASVRLRYGSALRTAEWVFTLLFTLEYATRLASAESAPRYARTVLGLIDLLAILPTYLSLLVPGGQAFTVIRILRVMRVFRVLKLAQFVGGEQLLIRALRASSYKIVVFLIAVVTVVVIVGSFMYFIEGPEQGFTSIPVGVYWAIVTLTTVGFGDITPQTAFGQVLAAMLMILGYAIIAVPTGIVTVEMAAAGQRPVSLSPNEPREPGPPGERRVCLGCAAEGHDADATHCKFCGVGLPA